MKFFKIVQILFILIVGLLVSTTSTNAQLSENSTEALGFTISPSITELYLEAGDEYTGKLGIEMDMTGPIPVSIEKSKYVPTLGEDRILTTELKDLTDWIKLSTSTFILEDNNRREIRYSLKVPDDARPGTYFSSVLFQPLLPESYFKDLSVHIFPYIGGLIVVNVVDDELDHSLPVIEEFRYRITQVSEYDFFHTKIVNNSDFYKGLEGEIIVQNFTNEIIDEIKVEETRLLPKEELDLNVLSTEDLKMGFYNAKIILSDGEETITDNTRFFVFDSQKDLPRVIIAGIIVGSVVYVGIKMKLKKNTES